MSEIEPPPSSRRNEPRASEDPAPESQPLPSAVSRAVAFHAALHQATPKVGVAYALVAINAAIFVTMLIKGVHIMTPTNQSLIGWGANYGPRTTGGEWWRLFTCMFLHAGVIHVAMNMIVLYNIGPFVERLTGRAGFLILYVIAGLAGSVASVAWEPSVLSVGASGAVFGVYGALLGFLLRGKGSIPKEVLAELQKSAMVFLGYNLLFGLSQKGIDMAAHLGGLAGGFGGGLLLAHPITREAVAGRAKRSALLALAGVSLIAAMTRALPHGADVQGALERFEVEEAEVIDLVNGAVDKARAGSMSDAEFAELLETKAIPKWHARRMELSGMQHIPKDQEKLVSQLTRYMAAREEGWTLLAEGLRSGDPKTVERATKRQEEAAALIKQIGK